MKSSLHIILLLIGLSIAATACIDDSYSTSPADKLEFSIDTIKFDTIFTDLTTPVVRFTVYNRGKKQVSISDIHVNGESDAKFLLNVDGLQGTEFHDVSIRGKDSIFIHVQARIEEQGSDAPLRYLDRIYFTTNTNQQQVVLTAWGQDVIRLTRPEIEGDVTFTDARPYVIFDTLTVKQGATLTLAPGARLYFHDKAAMQVEGTLMAVGTKDKIIDLRGDRTDHVVGDIDFDIMSNQWGGVNFKPESYGNEMQYVYMRGSATGVTIDSCAALQRKLHIFNSVLHNSAGSVLTVRHAWVEAEGTEFSDASDAVVKLRGGKIRMVNCTFGNYYLFSSISEPILTLEYALPDQIKGSAPAMDATIDNSIIYGIAPDINLGDLTYSNVFIRNTLFRSEGVDDDNFINCLWGSDPKWYVSRNDYIFDYRLRNESPAIGAGLASYLPATARYDRYGNDRLAGGTGNIDLGAYVYVYNPDDVPVNQ